jgi:predicted metalloprotease
MRLGGLRRSTNVSDRRGGGGLMVGGGIGGLVVVVVALLLGVNPGDLMQGGAAPAAESTPANDEAGQWVEQVLGTTEDAWTEIFQRSGQDYPEPQLVLFSGSIPSACGFAQSAIGPFYCPRDQSVYIDLSFYQELRDRFGAPGDMAQAYVIAHEVGHHVQNITGSLGQPGRDSGPNSQAVRVELQADCYAGIWANHAKNRNILDPGDVEEALNAAAAIGDDRLQKQTQGQVVPESFTHGSSEQRVRWFRTGFESGDVQRCDTFRATNL